jgi:GNAT superfamily N-acetyltransferase
MPGPDQTYPKTYTTRPLTRATWDAFARLVEANNGVWGGCWCMGFHPEGFGDGTSAQRNRDTKESLVRRRKVHQTLVFAGGECVGWCQYGTPAELPNIKNRKAYDQGLASLPDWRIGCVFTDKRHRGEGVARVAVTATLEAIRRAGGGVVEAYPEQVTDRKPQAGAFFHTGPETLFEDLGFTRDRRIAKWRWVMRMRVDS